MVDIEGALKGSAEAVPGKTGGAVEQRVLRHQMDLIRVDMYNYT